MNQTIEAFSRLSESQIAEIRALEEACRAHDHTTGGLYLDSTLNFDQEMDAFYLLREESVLAAALVVFAPGREEAEISAVTKPEFRRRGCFRALCARAAEEVKARGVPSLLLVCDRESDDGFETAAAMGARLDHTEYSLGYEGGKPKESSGKLTLKLCTLEDVPVVARLSGAIFGDSTRDGEAIATNTVNSDNRDQFLALAGGKPAGMVSTGTVDGVTSINGLGILPEYRGQGLGRELLTLVLRALFDGGVSGIELEVDSDNEIAHRLYNSSGFVDRSATDYYRLSLSGEEGGAAS